MSVEQTIAKSAGGRSLIRHSIIICTSKIPEVALFTIAGLKKLILFPDSTEIILVNNGGIQHIQDYNKGLKNLFENSEIKYKVLFEPTTGISHARNHGLDNAAGEIITFLDDDVVPTSEMWQQNIIDIFMRDTGIALCSGPIWLDPPVGLPEHPWWRSYQTDLYHSCFDWEKTDYCSGDIVSGGNASYRKNAILNQKFPEYLGWKQCMKLSLAGEETLFNKRLESLGWRCWYSQELGVLHRIESSRWRPLWLIKRAVIFGKTSAVFAHIQGETKGSVLANSSRWALKGLVLSIVSIFRWKRNEAFSHYCSLCCAMGRLSMLGKLEPYDSMRQPERRTS